jgi:hypothetical protein
MVVGKHVCRSNRLSTQLFFGYFDLTKLEPEIILRRGKNFREVLAYFTSSKQAVHSSAQFIITSVVQYCKMIDLLFEWISAVGNQSLVLIFNALHRLVIELTL